jgi:hypothetical protein
VRPPPLRVRRGTGRRTSAIRPRPRLAPALPPGRSGGHRKTPIRIGEHRRITVGCSQIDDDRLAGTHQPARDLGVGHRHPRRQLHRGVQSQDLLDRTRPQIGILPQQRELIRGIHQHLNAVAQQIDRGFETGRQDQAGHAVQFDVGQRGLSILAVAGPDQLAHQVVAGVTAQLRQVPGEPGVERAQTACHRTVLRPA